MEKIFFHSESGDFTQEIICENWDNGILRKKEKAEKQKKNISVSQRNLFQERVRVDLHGNTAEEALSILESLPLRYPNRKCFLIVTGKGMNSGENGPVLKPLVKEWLNKNSLRIIKKFKESPKNLGGAGAYIVYLK